MELPIKELNKWNWWFDSHRQFDGKYFKNISKIHKKKFTRHKCRLNFHYNISSCKDYCPAPRNYKKCLELDLNDQLGVGNLDATNSKHVHQILVQ